MSMTWTKRPPADGAQHEARRVTRKVSAPVQRMLWGKAAGRCEFAGCPRVLWKSDVTQEQVNIAQKAHIYAFNTGGARGNEGIPPEQLNDLENLMLVCDPCHKKMDREKDGGRYTVSLLKEMKQRHERRIELAAGIPEDMSSHIVLYGANIGEHSSPLKYPAAATAMFPKRYPATDRPIQLGMTNSAQRDDGEAYWLAEAAGLERHFQRKISERLADGDIDHMSIFALAPQPLLIRLGTLLIDIAPAEVYQLHREPAGWAWPEGEDEPVNYQVTEPDEGDGPVALVLAISATVTSDRIEAVLGEGARVWTITVAEPHNDIIKSPADLGGFRSMVRPLLDRIKARHGQEETLHVFPAAPASVAVELGRVRMPKADMPWLIFDQNNNLGGFVPALTINGGADR